ncbi:MAG: ABC transporter ATP-binding protein [Candidatus Lokiarchaeota archaeon]|nr:ABC transporter ATP-binding protein [Candidatus Lokiarchaeota archaeon]
MKNNNLEVLIKFNNLTKKFGTLYAVRNVSLEIKRGEIVGFLGPNGAGKTTTMKMMANLLKPNEGEVLIRANGEFQKLTNKNKDYLLDNMGFLIEIPAFYERVTPKEILGYFAKLKGYPRKSIDRRIDTVLNMMEMLEWKNKYIGTFSKGMKQKIGIMSAIIHDPDIIVLDEPQTGLDPAARKEVRDFILKLKKQGKTVFLSSHLLYEISEVADRIAIINKGKLIAFDTLENLERKVRKSVINFELLKPPEENVEVLIDKLRSLIGPLTGISERESWIKYDDNSKIFQVLFDGNPENQALILKKLLNDGQDILEYSVPKAGLLEILFMELTKSDERKGGGIDI